MILNTTKFRSNMAIYSCPYCGGEITRLPPDGIDYCPDCGIVETYYRVEPTDEESEDS